jgi:hypothetical protein
LDAFRKLFQDTFSLLTENQVSIFVNVLSSFIFFVLGGLFGAYSKIRSYWLRHKVRKAWGFKKTAFVFSGSKRQSNTDQTVIRNGDFHAIVEMLKFFQTWLPETQLVISEVSRVESYDFYYNSDVILIGGPNNNPLTKKTLDELDKSGKLPFEFDGYCIKATGHNMSYCIEENDEGSIVKDYGVIFKVANPFNPAYNIVIVAGCKSYATLACAKLFSRPDFYDNHIKIHENCFCFLVECSVENDKLMLFKISNRLDRSL